MLITQPPSTTQNFPTATADGGGEKGESQMAGNNEDSFQWDEHSQLYYHASSGFYHDPAAGWYYSSKDGLYYKFENGSYVPWETDQVDPSNANQSIITADDNSAHYESYKHEPCNKVTDEVKFEDGDTECLINDVPENLPPPSEWLEDTLIELYLSGYSTQTTDGADDTCLSIATEDVENDKADELEEGEWVPDETHEVVDECGVAADEDAFEEEEMWRAQYGQPVRLDKELVPDYPVVDLWDWSMVKETKRIRKRRIRRLVGRLVKRDTKLHPSMPSSGRVLKTAPICEVHLDLVRVRSGRVYKLRTPKVSYLASLSSYDSSNPTKDWGFPELSMVNESQTLVKSSQHIEPKCVGVHVEEDGPEKELSLSEKHKGNVYRDRAAERRTLHGGFGVGPGQKKSADDVDPACSSPVSATPEEAASEALKMSFGDGSYARRILEKMGWKEGEALGSSMKGITEPLLAVGNKGSSGLGWNQNSNWNRV
ncbi:putative G-patch domain, OCRE domain-containing protein [Helianthus annuus]|nr:putative G-patch domain, OCRE domain-containing protein [Helianthus annuus]